MRASCARWAPSAPPQAQVGGHSPRRRWPDGRIASSSTAGLSEAGLDREIERLRERLAQVSTTPTDVDRIRLWQLEAERRRRDLAAEARVQRAPLGGILSQLALLKAAASRSPAPPTSRRPLTPSGLPSRPRLAAVPPDTPLPPDLHLVMAALALWSTDPGNKWGEGIFDSKDLVLSAADYATVPAGQNKCNAYVAEVLNRSLGLVFRAIPSTEQPGRFFPIRARDWADPKTAIPHFPVAEPGHRRHRVNRYPRPGCSSAPMAVTCCTSAPATTPTVSSARTSCSTLTVSRSNS